MFFSLGTRMGMSLRKGKSKETWGGERKKTSGDLYMWGGGGLHQTPWAGYCWLCGRKGRGLKRKLRGGFFGGGLPRMGCFAHRMRDWGGLLDKKGE